MCDSGRDWQVTQLSDGKLADGNFPFPTLRNSEAQAGFQAAKGSITPRLIAGRGVSPNSLR